MAKYKPTTNDNGLEVKIIKSYVQSKFDFDKMVIVSGYDPTNPTWEMYLEQFEPDQLPYILLIRETIINNKVLGKTASQYSYHTYFEFSDGVVWHFTNRAFSDLMQSIVNKREGYEIYL
jgi:hypothetical protein